MEPELDGQLALFDVHTRREAVDSAEGPYWVEVCEIGETWHEREVLS